MLQPRTACKQRAAVVRNEGPVRATHWDLRRHGCLLWQLKCYNVQEPPGLASFVGFVTRVTSKEVDRNQKCTQSVAATMKRISSLLSLQEEELQYQSTIFRNASWDFVV